MVCGEERELVRLCHKNDSLSNTATWRTIMKVYDFLFNNEHLLGEE